MPATTTSTTVPARTEPLTFQELLFRLQTFWAEHGCILQQPYDVEVGAGTMSPDTFLRVLGPRPVNIAYAQPSRRPADGRYAENPNRLYKHTQFQVILKPPPADIQEVYLASLEAIGIELSEHDIKFEEDNWESPTLGAWGIGWQVMLDGQEITQFTYFQQCGGIDLDPISGEITYGLERLAQFLQDAESIYDIVWVRDSKTGKAVTYRDIRFEEELQFSVYNFEAAEVEKLWEHLRLYEAECQDLLASYNDSFSPAAEKKGERHQKIHDRLVHESTGSETAPVTAVADPATEDVKAQQRRFPVLGAYDLCLRCSHLFNLLDARGAISVTERVGVIARIRALAVGVAKAYVAQQELAASS
ncbi:MAG: glycine--tRNA ligase subunit alpha [Silvibacterium sp.]|nr:glycine--tRNA ligase subunit alpha [Silvibacterium sp.]